MHFLPLEESWELYLGRILGILMLRFPCADRVRVVQRKDWPRTQGRALAGGRGSAGNGGNCKRGFWNEGSHNWLSCLIHPHCAGPVG